MQGSEEDSRPYSYKRSFVSATVAAPPPDADKDALDMYIRSVLGVKDEEKEPTA